MIVRFNTDIVQDTIWKALKESGWTTVQVKAKRQRHFHAPKSAKNQKTFDSCIKMINFVRSDPEWKDNDGISKALVEYDKFVDELHPTTGVLKRTKSGVADDNTTAIGKTQRKRKNTDIYSPNLTTLKRRRMTPAKDVASDELPILKCDLLLFWDTLWVTLEELYGWTMNAEKKKKYYLRPVTKNRNVAMESGRQVLDYIRSTPEWIQKEPIQKALRDYEKALEKKRNGKKWTPTNTKKMKAIKKQKTTPDKKKRAPTANSSKKKIVKVKARCAFEGGCEKQSQGARFNMMCWSHFRVTTGKKATAG